MVNQGKPHLRPPHDMLRRYPFGNLRIRIGGTGLLARDSKDGVHVVVTHVSSLGSNVLWVHGQGHVLGAHCGLTKKKRIKKDMVSEMELEHRTFVAS